jgi:DNA replication protein DnaC
MTEPVASHAELRAQAAELRLHGLLAHWDELIGQPETERRVRQWLGWESTERAHRSLERRLREAHLGRFKPLADFDWSWPKQCDRAAIEELMSLQFLTDASSVVLFGTNGVGKTMVALNIAHQAVLQGHTALFTTAAQMLVRISANVTGDFGSVTDSKPMLCCAGKIVGMMSC